MPNGMISKTKNFIIEIVKNADKRGWALFALAMAGIFLAGLLAASIIERRREANLPPQYLNPIGEWESDNSVWGKDFPREYETYLKTAATNTKTKYGGSFKRDYLQENPRIVILFSGYAFSKEYNQARGHFMAVKDVTETKRVNEKTPGTCFTCKSPDVPRLMNDMGPAKFYETPFMALKPEIKHPIGCLDCHDPKTMNLRISRPALKEALERQKIDISRISFQEMRTLVCAQCHVEYYFKGKGNYLTFPWDKGIKADDMDIYYEENQHVDWVHPISGTKMIKMQHPDYEKYKQGVHAYRNVSCADCHMPYITQGGVKLTDHHVQSPLLNVSESCGVCHRWSEEEIIKRIESIQDKVVESRTAAEDALVMAHFDIAAAIQKGATDPELETARHLLRRGQMYWDYVAANNGVGFHAPQESVRLLNKALNLAQECRLNIARLLASKGVSRAPNYPDISTKEKATAVRLLFEQKTPPDLWK